MAIIKTWQMTYKKMANELIQIRLHLDITETYRRILLGYRNL